MKMWWRALMDRGEAQVQNNGRCGWSGIQVSDESKVGVQASLSTSDPDQQISRGAEQQ